MRTWPLLFALTLASAPARAAPARVVWTEVAVRDGADGKHLGKALERLLKKASRRADWGKHKGAVRLSARIARFDWQPDGDVLSLDVVVVGRLLGGEGHEVRSRIRVGGRPNDRKKLERQGLRIVAEGLVTRLAEIARM